MKSGRAMLASGLDGVSSAHSISIGRYLVPLLQVGSVAVLPVVFGHGVFESLDVLLGHQMAILWRQHEARFFHSVQVGFGRSRLPQGAHNSVPRVWFEERLARWRVRHKLLQFLSLPLRHTGHGNRFDDS